jgi:hypothetical protein
LIVVVNVDESAEKGLGYEPELERDGVGVDTPHT